LVVDPPVAVPGDEAPEDDGAEVVVELGLGAEATVLGELGGEPGPSDVVGISQPVSRIAVHPVTAAAAIGRSTTRAIGRPPERVRTKIALAVADDYTTDLVPPTNSLPWR
jgi:hypothetical protein